MMQTEEAGLDFAIKSKKYKNIKKEKMGLMNSVTVVFMLSCQSNRVTGV